MSKKTSALIDIIIPNWNGRSMLETCLASLQLQTCEKFRIIVVDNGSTDDSVDFIRQSHPEVHLVCFSENKGFSAAVNEGIRVASAPWVLLFNNDIEVDKHCLQILVDQGTEQDDFDIFALKMLAFDQRSVLDGAGDGVLRGGVGYRLGTLERDGLKYSLRREVFGACAGAALYRRSLFDSIGNFDEDFFAYLEDVDFNMRAVRCGSRCLYLPEAVIYHMGSATSGSKINHFTVSLSTRNNIFVLIKNYSPMLFIRFLPMIVVYQLFWLLFVIKKRKFLAYITGLCKSLPLIPVMFKKGAGLRRRQVLSVKEFGDSIIKSEKNVIHSIMLRRTQQGKSNRALEFYLRLFC